MANQHKEKLRGVRGVDDALWTDLDTATKAVGSDRSNTTRQLWEWFVGRPDAELPQRPTDTPPLCGARTVFWPAVEACDAECIRPRGHDPADVHEDETLGEWNEDELATVYPDDRG